MVDFVKLARIAFKVRPENYYTYMPTFDVELWKATHTLHYLFNALNGTFDDFLDIWGKIILKDEVLEKLRGIDDGHDGGVTVREVYVFTSSMYRLFLAFLFKEESIGEQVDTFTKYYKILFSENIIDESALHIDRCPTVDATHAEPEKTGYGQFRKDKLHLVYDEEEWLCKTARGGTIKQYRGTYCLYVPDQYLRE